jgi:hypothetical protein
MRYNLMLTPISSPRDAEYQHVAQGIDAQYELGGNAETAATTTSAGPEQIRLRGCGGLQRVGLRINQGNLLEIVAGQAVRPGEQSMSAP